jgi:DNA-binding NarL/FixJ family response regulator
MEFKHEELVEREIEIASYLVQNFSINHIAKTTGLTNKIIVAHIKNMMQKLKAGNMEALIKALKE